jgi:hypothetical protein
MTAISIVLGVIVALAASPIVAEWYRGLRREGTLGNGELVEKFLQRMIAASEPMVPRSVVGSLHTNGPAMVEEHEGSGFKRVA